MAKPERNFHLSLTSFPVDEINVVFVIYIHLPCKHYSKRRHYKQWCNWHITVGSSTVPPSSWAHSYSQLWLWCAQLRLSADIDYHLEASEIWHFTSGRITVECVSREKAETKFRNKILTSLMLHFSSFKIWSKYQRLKGIFNFLCYSRFLVWDYILFL